MIDRILSQEEIDSVFRHLRESSGEEVIEAAPVYDFQRPDRIAKDQLRAIHQLSENFARSLASSLSAYLRAYVAVNLVSVEQLSFSEFIQCLPSPTVVCSLAMRPYDGNAALEMNSSLVFPMLEILLGGNNSRLGAVKVEREITEIEQSILEGVYRILLHELRKAWSGVADFDFAIEGTETDPQMLRLLAPTEAVVAVSMEVRLGDSTGMMNIGIPSIIIKMLRQKFDSAWALRRSESSSNDQANRLIELLLPAVVNLDARLDGAVIKTQDLLELEEGEILCLDVSIDAPARILLNGVPKHFGTIVENGRKKCVHLAEPIVSPATAPSSPTALALPAA